MQIQMIVGFSLGVVVLVGFAIWHFVIKRPAKEVKKAGTPAAKPATPQIYGGLRSLKTVALTIPSSKSEPVVQEVNIPATAIPKYRAMVWNDSGIIFKKIPERIGATFYCDPTMPQKGEFLWVVESVENGLTKYAPFDPREIPIISEETPEWAYDSIHCYKEVYAWFKNKADLWDKINSVLIGLAIVGMVLVCLVALDKITK